MGDNDKSEFRVMDPEIYDQIKLARKPLVDDPRFDLVRQHQIYHFLRGEANKHSVALEFPNGVKIRKGQAREIALANLQSAQEFFVARYKGELTDKLLMDSAAILEPKLGNPATYRSVHSPTTRSLGGGSIYPQNVSDEMTLFIRENGCLKNVVSKAIHSHYHLLRIHPFADGNGRLVQNSVLANAGLPPIIIEQFERKEYLDLLQQADQSYREHRVLKPELTTLFNYLALKLRDSLVATQRKIASGKYF